ncbi:MAG TPA: signal recognition particle protein [Alphaproteobacteria bacterium]|nr:signal recognition particle protein [Alphaproteobacteria bacterium]
MFDTLSQKLTEAFGKLTRRGALSEADVIAALREVRVALLEADVALPVVRDFIEHVRVRAVGQEVLRSVTPGQQVVKIVNDELIEMLGGRTEQAGLNLAAAAPAVLMMVGLQGSGKTTSTAKVARRLTARDRKKTLMASLDTRRPAAMEQLKILGEQANVPTLPIMAGQTPVDIARRALEAARLGGYDVLILDTAGRLSIDEELMSELAQVRDIAKPVETLLVADSLTGQDAVKTASTFNERIGITGIMLTRVDGDGRGGAALSMRAVTGRPIKLLGTGEKLDGLEDFRAERVASRILDMGDVVSLVEKAAETIDAEKAEKMAKKLQKGSFDLDDLADQLKQMRKLGGMNGLLGMLPGVGKIKQQIADANLDDRILKRQEAIISSMTKEERRNPKVLNASRRRRIAAGSGTEVQDINRLIKMHQQMEGAIKQMGKMAGKGGPGALFGGGGTMPQMPMPQGNLPKGFTPPAGMMPKLPGLGGAMPPRGLPGLPTGDKKK